MMRLIIRLLIIILTIALQVSFLPNIFSSFALVPLIVLPLAIAWVLRDGFRSALPWIIVLGLLYDLLLVYPFGLITLMLVVTSFMAQFISLQFVAEHRVWGLVILFFIVGVLSLCYNTLVMIIAQYFFGYGSPVYTLSSLLVFACVSALSFWPLLKIVKKTEVYLSYYGRRIDIKKHA